MSGKVIAYGDSMSQPSRAVWWLALLAEVPNFEYKLIQIAKGQQLSPEFAKINPMKKLPALSDDGYLIFESHTILRYLAQKFAPNSAWYPSDLKQRAAVDMYLDWHHLNLRFGAANYFRRIFFPQMSGQPVDTKALAPYEKAMKAAMNTIETHFLADKPFISGSTPSIADLSAYEEIRQLESVGVDFAQWPKINAWMARVKELPHYGQVHKFFDAFVARQRQQQQQAKM